MKTTETLTVDYDVNRYDFCDWAKETLGVDELSNIHMVDEVKHLNQGPVFN